MMVCEKNLTRSSSNSSQTLQPKPILSNDSLIFTIIVGDDNKRFSSLRSSTNNNQPNVADAKTNIAAASIAGDKKPQKAGPKARKPIDLGAAANFAQQSTQHSTRQAEKSSVSNTIDLFGTDGGETINSTPQQPSSLVITGDDDFNPRGSIR